MSSTLDLVQRAVGQDKFIILASAIEQVSDRQLALEHAIALDDQIATLDVEELANQYEVTFETMREKLRRTLGQSSVYRLGRKWVIRKRKYLDFLLALENEQAPGEAM